jgi:hypothetical protein
VTITMLLRNGAKNRAASEGLMPQRHSRIEVGVETLGLNPGAYSINAELDPVRDGQSCSELHAMAFN